MHILILGMTESGKSNAGKVLIETMRKRGIKSIVLDPLKDPSFNADFQTDNPDHFINVVFGDARKCLVIVDESGEAIGRYNTTMNQLATRGRHWGHTCVFICQKAVQIAPIIRDQCGAVFMFCSGKPSGKMIGEEFNSDKFLDCTKLRRGEYLYKTRFSDIVEGNVFDDLKSVGLYRK